MNQHAIVVSDRSDPALEQFLGDGLDEFQAPGFYQKNGWVSFGEIPSGRQGISRVFMLKTL